MTKDLLTTARERELGAYLVALDSAGLRSVLEAEGPFTLFIPIDSAFERFSTSELDALETDVDALRRLMRYTIVRGALAGDSLARLDSVETIGGETLDVSAYNGLAVNGIKILEIDLECSNGVAHILAETPIPPSLREIIRPEMLAPPSADAWDVSNASDASDASKVSPNVSDASASNGDETDASRTQNAAQTAETIENAARNYASTAETARPGALEKEYAPFADDLLNDAPTGQTFDRPVDDEENEEEFDAFERGYERAETSPNANRDDFYADIDAHFAENDEENAARRDAEDCVCVGDAEKASSV